MGKIYNKFMPTIRQKKAAIEIVENGGVVSTAMIASGYSKNTAKTPSKLTDSDGFKELMIGMGIDDTKLLNVLNDGLNAMKIVTSHTEPDRDIPDHPTRHKFLETGLKLRGILVENKQGNITQINIGNGEAADKMRSKFTEFLEAETLD